MILEKFKYWVKHDPQKTCVNDQKKYSYQVIYEIAINVRDYINKLKLEENEGIGLIMTNSAYYVATILGCYMAGHPVILFDKKIKKQELNQLTEKICIGHLIVCNQFVSELGFSNDVREVVSPIDAVMITTERIYNPDTFLQGDFICQFTSGTNGMSKACIRTEEAVWNEIVYTNKILHIEREDYFLVLPPMHHSYGLIAGVLLPLCMGCSVQFVPQFIPADVLKILGNQRVTVLFAVPFMYKILIETLQQKIKLHKTQYDFGHLKYCLSAGALLDPQLSSLFFSLFNKQILNDYGSTETGVICLNADNKYVDSAGLPVDYKIDIVDENKNVLPVGETGNIVLSGKSLFRKYALFNPTYDTDVSNGIWFTGDIGYKNKEGYVYVKGRAGQMINISGCKVDPVEVENVLLQFPGITQAVVMGIKKEYLDQYLKAFIVADKELKEKEVYAFCRNLLSDYKVPRELKIVKDIPRTQTGKIIRKNLLD